MNEKILEMVAQYKEDSFFTYAEFTDEARVRAEKSLNVILPDQYVEYLKAFGHGGGCRRRNSRHGVRWRYDIR